MSQPITHEPSTDSPQGGRFSKPHSEVELSREQLLSPDDPVEGFFTPDEWNAIGRALDLSKREMAVTVLLTKGVSRQGIASYLHKADGSCLSADTVRVYIDRVFRKARVTGRLALLMRLARVYLLLHGANASGGRSPAVAAHGHKVV